MKMVLFITNVDKRHDIKMVGIYNNRDEAKIESIIRIYSNRLMPVLKDQVVKMTYMLILNKLPNVLSIKLNDKNYVWANYVQLIELQYKSQLMGLEPFSIYEMLSESRYFFEISNIECMQYKLILKILKKQKIPRHT
jgi:hypothetical protein